MLSKNSFYSDGTRAYKIAKLTDKTVLFVPVKSKYENVGDVSSAFLYDSVHRASDEIDKNGTPIRFRLVNNFSTKGLAAFYEEKHGSTKEMYELEGDTFTIEHNYG